MTEYPVDDDLAALVEQLAKKKPFESLSFNTALRRVLQDHLTPRPKDKRNDDPNALFAEAMAAAARAPKKVPTPSAAQWLASVPELKSKKDLNTWKAICVLLKIDTAGDSARRKLKNWVKSNRPAWPAVPDID